MVVRSGTALLQRREAFDGAHGGDQRLPDHLPTEHALPAVLRRAAAKQIHLKLLEVEHIEHGLDGSFGHGVLADKERTGRETDRNVKASRAAREG